MPAITLTPVNSKSTNEKTKTANAAIDEYATSSVFSLFSKFIHPYVISVIC